jgi:hypothetical protein
MIQKHFYSLLIILMLVTSSCVSSPPEKPDNICEIFEEKRSWYKAAIKAEKKMEASSLCFDGIHSSRIKFSS